MATAGPLPMSFAEAGALDGTVSVPGDKSISHRALMLAAMARGCSLVEGVSEGSDVAATAQALRAMGTRIGRDGQAWAVDGLGTGCLLQPQAALDMGNSGTAARLLMGLAASHPITATFIGDASLSRRPMDRVIAPLARIGAEIVARAGGLLPLVVRGRCPAVPRSFRMEVPSAQVKSALLLAGLNTPGITEVIEPVPTRDHSERLLKLLGAEIDADGERIRLRGEAELQPQRIIVPGDASAAAFLVVAALIVPGSDVLIRNVGVNPLRIGLLTLLRRMGGDIHVEHVQDAGAEPVADVRVRHSRLCAAEVPPELAPAMIDELPIFFIAAAFAQGTSRARGVGELRVKESDRLAAMAHGLAAIGATVEELEDGLAVTGTDGAPLAGGATIDPRLDHRIAISFAVAGLRCREPVRIADMSPADTSFPGFAGTIERLLQR